ncbi:hypothetical protein DFJ74DRAFT_604316 [Hyaloraphidium curvatum]|nr:hypothetical protein DFJ74DRAFT_604316 [Hyaloraphidium curvatum]
MGDVRTASPGENITTDGGFMRGHGTYPMVLEDGASALVAAVPGVVERVNKLVSVRPLRARYGGDIGDVVVGRVTEVGFKRWKVDVNGRQDATLYLSSVNLPGGVQRRKTEMDELNMRSFFEEGDLICAEIQSFFGDGAASLHTRNLRYGKAASTLSPLYIARQLRNGSLVVVPAAQVKRMKSHFHSLPFGVDMIVGINGYIWVCKHAPQTPDQAESEAIYSSENEPIPDELRLRIAQVCRAVSTLGRYHWYISEPVIRHILSDPAKLSLSDEDFLRAAVLAMEAV